jgi:hypothetical protein
MATADFPWYSVVRGLALEQGDLLLGCPRFLIPAEAGRADGARCPSSARRSMP